MAVISLNLGVVNLLPIPVLDGGHLFMLGIEKLMRRKPSPKFMDLAFRSGGALIFGVFTVVTAHDVYTLLADNGFLDWAAF
jgi:regulator of sigma E protease